MYEQQDRKARGRRDMVLFSMEPEALAVSGRCQTAEIFPKVEVLRTPRRDERREDGSNRTEMMLGYGIGYRWIS